MGQGEAIVRARESAARMAPRTLPHTCTISTPTSGASAAYGEQVAGTPTEVTGVRCSFEPIKAYEKIGDSGVLAAADYRLELPYFHAGEPLSIPSNATITIDGENLTFRVVGAPPSSSDLWQQVAATLIQ